MTSKDADERNVARDEDDATKVADDDDTEGHNMMLDPNSAMRFNSGTLDGIEYRGTLVVRDENGNYGNVTIRNGIAEWIPPPRLDVGQNRINYYHHPERILTPD